MGISVRWLQEPYIRLVSYEDVVTTQDFEQLLTQEWQLCEHSSNSIYIILDTHKLTKLAVNPLRLPGFIKLIRHRRLVYFAIIASNPTSSFWAKTISQIVRVAPLHVVQSVDEACQSIKALIHSEV